MHKTSKLIFDLIIESKHSEMYLLALYTGIITDINGFILNNKL